MPKPLRTALVMHPVVAEELIRPDHMQRLERAVTLVTPTPVREFDALGEDLARLDILITSWGCPAVDETIVDRMPRLQLLAHLAGSVKGFLDDVVWRRGIMVTNAVAANAVPVAEYTLATILFANKRIFQLQRAYQAERDVSPPSPTDAAAIGNYRRTIGVVGASHVGRLVIQHLKHFDFRVLLYDPYVSPMAARELGVVKVALADLLAESHVVTLHVPLLPETRHLLGPRELALMRDGATLINTSRGAVIDQQALETELARGRLFAVLDTTDPDRLPADSPLFDLPNVFLTPHIAGSLGRETERLTDCIVDEIERFARGAGLKHLVRREQLPRLA